MRPQTRALVARINELHRQGLGPKQIAHEVGRAVRTVVPYIDRPRPAGGRRRWFGHRVPNEVIAAKLAEGLSIYQVELELGYANGGLHWRVDRYQLRPQQQPQEESLQ